MKNGMIKRIVTGVFAAAMILAALPQAGATAVMAADIFPDAKELKDNASVTDTAAYEESITYKYTVTERGTFYFSVKSDSSQYVHLYNAEGAQLEIGGIRGVNQPYKSETYSNVPGTVFYLKVGPSYRSSASWTVTCHFTASENNEIEPNDSSDEATELTAGEQMYGVLSDLSDVDCYYFTAPSDGKISIILTNQGGNAFSAWNLSVNGDTYTTAKSAASVSSDEFLIKEGSVINITVTNTNRYSDRHKYAVLADFRELTTILGRESPRF